MQIKHLYFIKSIDKIGIVWIFLSILKLDNLINNSFYNDEIF
jgi:hypothetical protein